jgi:hypothetical protein
VLNPEKSGNRRAGLRNLSQTGRGLLSDRPFEPGKVIQIALARMSSGAVYVLKAQVAHVTEGTEGTYHVGARLLDELTHDDWQTLMQESFFA